MKDSAIGIVFRDPHHREVLLVQRGDVPVWVLPGGGIDPGESPEEACLREVLEETGVGARIVRKVGHFLPINRFTSGAHVFLCEVEKGVLTPGEDEHCVGFFPVNQLPELLFHFHRDWLSVAALPLSTSVEEHLSRATFWRMVAFYCMHPVWAFRYLRTRYRNRQPRPK